MKLVKSTVFCFIILLSIGYIGCDKELICTPDVPELTEQENHLPYYFPERQAFGDLNDGEYTGKIRCGLELGKVEITVDDNMVVGCEIVSLIVSPYIFDLGPGEEILENGCDFFLDAQSPQFDAVTGATGSSHVLKICLTRALWEAAEKQDPMAKCVPVICR